MRFKTKFSDWDETAQQIWGLKCVISKFKDRDDISEQV